MKIKLSELKKYIQEAILTELDPSDFAAGGAGEQALQGAEPPEREKSDKMRSVIGRGPGPAASTSLKDPAMQSAMFKALAGKMQALAKVGKLGNKDEVGAAVDAAFAEMQQQENIERVAEAVLNKLRSKK